MGYPGEYGGGNLAGSQYRRDARRRRGPGFDLADSRPGRPIRYGDGRAADAYDASGGHCDDAAGGDGDDAASGNRDNRADSSADKRSHRDSGYDKQDDDDREQDHNNGPSGCHEHALIEVTDNTHKEGVRR